MLEATITHCSAVVQAQASGAKAQHQRLQKHLVHQPSAPLSLQGSLLLLGAVPLRRAETAAPAPWYGSCHGEAVHFGATCYRLQCFLCSEMVVWLFLPEQATLQKVAKDQDDRMIGLVPLILSMKFFWSNLLFLLGSWNGHLSQSSGSPLIGICVRLHSVQRMPTRMKHIYKLLSGTYSITAFSANHTHLR